MTTREDKEAQQKEDMLLDLYKIHAYIPNDAEGNPLTPFGNFCAGWQACDELNKARIAELENDCIEVGRDYAGAMFENDDLIAKIAFAKAILASEQEPFCYTVVQKNRLSQGAMYRTIYECETHPLYDAEIDKIVPLYLHPSVDIARIAELEKMIVQYFNDNEMYITELDSKDARIAELEKEMDLCKKLAQSVMLDIGGGSC